MSDRWIHERENLETLDTDEDGVQRGTVERWWYGDAAYPRRNDPQVWIEASRRTEDGREGWTYMVQDAWDLADMEQHMTRSDAVEDARDRVELYRERVED